MARRASSTTNPVWFIAVAVLIAAAIGIGWFLKSRVADPFRTLPVFPVKDYLENANSLRGNTYKLQGRVGSQLAYQPSNRLFEVVVEGDPVPVLVPSQFNHLDLRKDQQFLFKVEVANGGVLTAKEVQKE